MAKSEALKEIANLEKQLAKVQKIRVVELIKMRDVIDAELAQLGESQPAKKQKRKTGKKGVTKAAILDSLSKSKKPLSVAEIKTACGLTGNLAATMAKMTEAKEVIRAGSKGSYTYSLPVKKKIEKKK